MKTKTAHTEITLQVPLHIFQISHTDSEAIKKNFVIRKEEFFTIIQTLKEKSRKDPIQHELILGRSGSGKSTLLKRVELELDENSALKNKYITVNLPEEQAGIYRLFDLWEKILENLRNRFKKDFALKEFEAFESDSAYTRYLYREISDFCAKKNKQIVLLLDNFDRIIENFTDDGNLLRETLINYNDIVIIGASAHMDEHFWDYKMPFYDFLRVYRLNKLDSEETMLFLKRWSVKWDMPEITDFIEKNPGKLESIRILSDGMPRTILLFVFFYLQQPELKTFDYLKKIMDNYTPLFRERIHNLTPPLRKIVEEMAFNWEACSTRDLVKMVKMESKLVSAYLKTLYEKGIVEKINTGSRNHLYRLTERFFNIWLIVTQGDQFQKLEMEGLSDFLEHLYNRIAAEQARVDTMRVSEPDAYFEGSRGPLFKIVDEIKNGVYQDVEQRIIQNIKKVNFEDLTEFIEELLIHQQRNLTLKIFNNPEFGDKLKKEYQVLYYVVLVLISVDKDKIHLKIPPELMPTVDLILARIKKRAYFYGYS